MTDFHGLAPTFLNQFVSGLPPTGGLLPASAPAASAEPRPTSYGPLTALAYQMAGPYAGAAPSGGGAGGGGVPSGSASGFYNPGQFTPAPLSPPGAQTDSVSGLAGGGGTGYSGQDVMASYGYRVPYGTQGGDTGSWGGMLGGITGAFGNLFGGGGSAAPPSPGGWASNYDADIAMRNKAYTDAAKAGLSLLGLPMGMLGGGFFGGGKGDYIQTASGPMLVPKVPDNGFTNNRFGSTTPLAKWFGQGFAAGSGEGGGGSDGGGGGGGGRPVMDGPILTRIKD